MTARLILSVTREGDRGGAAYAAMIRVRPASGRPVDRCMPLGSSAEIEVAVGPATVEALLPSGQTLSQTVVLADGEALPLVIAVPGAPDEALRWLSFTRDDDRPAGPRRSLLRSRVDRPTPASIDDVVLDFVRRPGERTTDVAVHQDLRRAEARVLHVEDARSVEVFSGVGASSLALARLRAPALAGVVRLCVLPGPWHHAESEREVHIALRPLAEDALPDVQIVPAHSDLASVVGFLGVGDQRALALLRDHFVQRAVYYMEMKARSPVAAALGLAMLLRLGDLSQVQGWSANLWRWFPGLPDGAALHTAALLRAPADTPAWRDEFREAALAAARGGLPMLTDSLRHLHDALGTLGDLLPECPDTARAAGWCGRLLRAADPDAVFTTVTLDAKDAAAVWGCG